MNIQQHLMQLDVVMLSVLLIFVLIPVVYILKLDKHLYVLFHLIQSIKFDLFLFQINLPEVIPLEYYEELQVLQVNQI